MTISLRLIISRTDDGLKAADIAMSLGNPKCMNIVLFGALTHVLGLEEIDWEDVIRDTVPPKFLELNLRAYRAGLEAARAV